MKAIIKKDKIILPGLKKGTEVRVYFSRETPTAFSNLPVATAVVGKTDELDWFENYTVLRIEARKPKIFGIFPRQWFVFNKTR